MKKYQIHCNTENKWYNVVSNNTLTKCPVDDTHSFDTDSVSIIDVDYTFIDGDLFELSLQEYKEIKDEQIDAKTSELVSNGFVFDSTVFSLGVSSQINWGNIKTNKDLFDSLGYFPLAISTKDNGEYSLAYADVDNFYIQALGTVKTHLDSGRALKLQINNATTIAEVDAVVDNR